MSATRPTGTRAMAQRIVNAEERFIAWVQEQIDCTRSEAEKVLDVYRKEKLVKIGAVDGQFRLKHGAFADPEVLLNAVNV
jgi:hypothetical protein